jgi:hypothetical protein
MGMEILFHLAGQGPVIVHVGTLVDLILGQVGEDVFLAGGKPRQGGGRYQYPPFLEPTSRVHDDIAKLPRFVVEIKILDPPNFAVVALDVNTFECFGMMNH